MFLYFVTFNVTTMMNHLNFKFVLEDKLQTYQLQKNNYLIRM